MLKKLMYLCCMANVALLSQSCCEDSYQIPTTINISSIPRQENILVWGIKNGKALEKITVRSYDNGNNTFYGINQSFSFSPSFDMSVDNSTLAIQYLNKDKVLQTDTITVSYTRSASYQSGCGAYVYVNNIKLEKSTAKLPITITLNR